MPVVTFFKSANSRDGEAIGVGFARVREDVAVGSSSVAVLGAGEYVCVGNNTAAMIAVSVGLTSPDAAVNGFPVGIGTVSPPLLGPVGSIVNVKTVV